MRKRLFQYFFRLEYLIASLLVMGMVQVLIVISDNLPEADDTSFLNPILDRIDFLNIADISLDAIFAVKDAEFPDARIKVVNVGEVAPTPDGMIALLIRKLHALGARVIGIDVYFDRQHFERFPAERQEEIEALVSALHDVPNVVVVNAFDEETHKPIYPLDDRVRASQAQYGFANLVPDPDGVVRRFLPRSMIEGEEWLSLPVRMLSIAQPDAIAPLLRLPPDPQIIYYTGTYMQFESAPIADVIFGSMYDGDYFKDAIVLVGFVNEGGLFYLGDTHKTPMGKKIGIEGPDMPGILVHANVINMLLKGNFISPVPIWADWLLVFLLSYLSIAVYRVFRTKPVSRFQVGVLITSMLFTEAVIVFFLPLIAFFYFDFKISYNLMATAVLLFIPASAFTTRVHFWILERRMRREFSGSANPLPEILTAAFEDEEAFPARVRLIHSGFVLTQFAWAVRACEAREEGRHWTGIDLLPGVEAWKLVVPEIAAVCDGDDAGNREMRYFLRFLAGKKDEQLRDSLVRETYFATELRGFNEFVYFEEWELTLAHMLQLWRGLLRNYLDIPLVSVDVDGDVIGLAGCDASTLAAARSELREQAPGVYGTQKSPSFVFTRLSPFCEWTECKLHRKHELFFFAGLLQKQRGMQRIPAYFGPTPTCEPVLPRWSVPELQELEANVISIERSPR
ncbi:MAG: CHASE2 domain-containing protein [Bacteroidetes bacterium]|nr:CHASE2 domain-containing protein [Bacteroidota bacterium]